MNKISTPVLQLDNVHKSYKEGSDGRLDILKGVSFALQRGECVALLGPSGSGKSTLLHVSGLLDMPGAGGILIDGQKTGQLKDSERTALRRKHMGFVYQFHHLLPEFSALENVMLPCLLNGMTQREASSRATELLGTFKLNHRLTHKPNQLSGGEQQRVAIARALVHTPKLLLADEPTGNLDPTASDLVFDELVRIVRLSGLSALIATHNMDFARRMDRIVCLSDGVLVDFSFDEKAS
jgi:lipoprotein-releasing system ATP-binding protein